MLTLFQPIVDGFHFCLAGLYGITHDWGIAVVLLTLAVRLLLFFVNLQSARQLIRQARLRPELEALRKKHGSDFDRLLRETARLYQKYGVKPSSTVISGLIQMPVLFALYRLLISNGVVMSSAIVPWVGSLAVADPLHIVPLVYAALSLIGFLIPIAAELAVAQSMLQRAGLPLVFVCVIVFVAWRTPVALGLYWATGSLSTVLERCFYRTKAGRALLFKGIAPAS